MQSNKLVLRPRSSTTIILALASLAFVIGGVFLAKDEGLKGLLVIIFFGLCALVFVIQLIPGSSQLTLTEQGFIVTSLFRSSLTKWSDVKAFKTGYSGRNNTVLFDYVDSHKLHETGKDIAKQLTGSHGALPSTYGMSASELLQIMNEWKNR